MRNTLATLVLFMAIPAFGDTPKDKPADKPADKIEIKNTFGFDYMKPKKACVKVTGALEKTIGKMKCEPVPDGTGSGKPAVADCKNAKETSGYLLFVKKADCEDERKTQLANAGGA
ncbi:MAG TPA: hypothetical protein VGM90_16715 [Kofleriaceae bacterium]|jgi:hypothetical protein